MALTERDLQAIKTILLEPMLERMSSLEVTVKDENDRRRNDVSDLYERDRCRAKETAELAGRVVSLEGWREGHEKAEDAATQTVRWSKGQKVAVWSAGAVVVLWLIDKAGDFITWIQGKGAN